MIEDSNSKLQLPLDARFASQALKAELADTLKKGSPIARQGYQQLIEWVVRSLVQHLITDVLLLVKGNPDVPKSFSIMAAMASRYVPMVLKQTLRNMDSKLLLSLGTFVRERFHVAGDVYYFVFPVSVAWKNRFDALLLHMQSGRVSEKTQIEMAALICEFSNCLINQTVSELFAASKPGWFARRFILPVLTHIRRNLTDQIYELTYCYTEAEIALVLAHWENFVSGTQK